MKIQHRIELLPNFDLVPFVKLLLECRIFIEQLISIAAGNKVLTVVRHLKIQDADNHLFTKSADFDLTSLYSAETSFGAGISELHPFSHENVKPKA